MKPLEVPLQIGGHDYKVIDDTAIPVTDGSQGQHRPNAEEIAVYRHLADSAKTQTFLHEVMEAVNYVWCNAELDHRHIEQISQALYQILPQLGAKIEWT